MKAEDITNCLSAGDLGWAEVMMSVLYAKKKKNDKNTLYKKSNFITKILKMWYCSWPSLMILAPSSTSLISNFEYIYV